MSLEDMSNEQTLELAALAKQLAENPETRKDFLRLTKKAKPDLPIPELEIEDATTNAVSKAYERVEGLENKWQASITELDSVKGEVYEVFEEVVLTGFKSKPNKEEYLNASVQFFFDGRYDETYIDDVKINNDIIYPDGREFDYLGDLTESVMTLLRNRWWSEGPGTYGTIYVDMSIDLIKVTYTEREREFAPTEMYIQITPENVKNEK